MNNSWTDAVISRIAVAVYVPAGSGKRYHTNRPYHGLVINDEEAEKDYVFSDGTVLHTGSGELFYLPKGSTYTVKDVKMGGCYAINFDADLSDVPFTVSFRSSEAVYKLFKSAARSWGTHAELCQLSIRRDLYDIILLAKSEQQRRYLPSGKAALISPAVKKISSDFTSGDITVSALAGTCGISEAYFRRLFLDEFGVSPKEYIINMRIGYAKQLLDSGQFAVNEVAAMCGYAEPCHFSREFTRYVGCSPSKYKKDNT